MSAADLKKKLNKNNDFHTFSLLKITIAIFMFMSKVMKNKTSIRSQAVVKEL